MKDVLHRGERQRDKRSKRIWRNTVMSMAAVVVFCTVYALVLPAITLGDAPICGQTPHRHSETCYRTQKLISQCAADGTTVLHTHNEGCYDGAGLWCSLPERIAHVHTEQCHETVRTLVCLIDEIAPHTHGEGCYGEAVSTLSCGVEEVLGHTHGEGCFETQTDLSCALEESETHTHAEGCYTGTQTLVCTQEEAPGHTHDESCYTLAQPLTCQTVETAGHSHDDGCYEMRDQYICGLEQIGEHTHSESCYDGSGNPVCGITCAQVHVHDESCSLLTLLPEPEQVCGMEEHIHGESCFPVHETEESIVYHCGLGIHTHGEGCRDTEDNLLCSLTEHAHSESCAVPDYDPTADLETPETWNASISNVKLTGKWSEDILAIAESQLGYRESSRNVMLENGSVKGYTRYGAWYGVPYGDWCAMFVSFCVNYAGAEAVPQDSVCDTYIEKLQAAELYRLPGNYMPKPGDLIFFDWERTGGEITDVDHAGLVAEILLDENGIPAQIKTIEGNWDDCVQYRIHSLTSPTIVGYGETPMGPANPCICGMASHIHTEDCLDAEGIALCGMEEHIHSDSCYGHSVFYRDDTLQAQLIVQGVDALPEDLTMTVIPITAEADPLRHGSMLASLELATEESPFFVSDAVFFHVELRSGGEIYTLPQGADAQVDITFAQPQFDAGDVAQGSGLYTYLLSPGEPITLFDGQTVETFETMAVTGESYANATGGLTGVRLDLGSGNDFAVMLSSTTLTGTFWTRVTDKSQLTADGTYMIISAEGNYALRGDTSSNNLSVLLETVKGNVDYYTIKPRSGSLNNEYYWTFTADGSEYLVRCQGTANYLLGASRYSIIGNRPTIALIAANAEPANLTYVTPENGWWINSGSTRYVYNNSGAFQMGTGANDTYYGNKYYARDMLIFKLSDVTKLEIPDDVVDRNAGYDEENGPDKPDYDPFIQPSDEKSGDTSLEYPGNPALNVPGKYYSDKATSDIEKKFDLDNYALNAENDGKILTDKSVIYMDDDYNAFESYAPNTFGVTLSALGQEYEMPHEDLVRTPIDVVFVLDVSGSMTTNAADGSAAGSNASRAEAMVGAVNKAIKQIMDDHPANRVGIALYATGAWQLLPLDRYTATDNLYLQINQQVKPLQNATSGTRTIHFVETTASLKSESGTAYPNIGTGFNQGYGTYTQAGIAMGGKTFADIGDDTTYTAVFGEGEEAREYIVNRQPVIILLSDGEPTHATNLYMDPIAGPHYGDGQGTTTNARGIMGYNVILTANYFKRMVGIQYDKTALFYTVGMGIRETGSDPLHGGDTSDTYKRAVLNPTAENINALDSSMVGGSVVNTQLKQLIQGTFTDTSVTVTPHWPDPWTGVPHTKLPVLQGNPYADNYSYADNAYFGDLTQGDLEDIFMKIVEDSLKATPYGFILHKSSSIVLSDQIGEGMCVTGEPVLRFAGVNYKPKHITASGNVIHYVYEGKYTHPYLDNRVYDLSEIAVTLTTDANGNQTMRMYVPDVSLPAYSPELIAKEFYYEALPVRLIYQVGLTEESEQKVLDLYKTGGSATFYTNRWENGGGQSVSNLYPSLENPFYYEIQENGETRYHSHHDLKDEGANVTDTLDYIVDCSKQQEVYGDGEVVTKVVHKLGNNGKLVFEVPDLDIPVEKQWSGDSAPEGDLSLELMIYNVQTTSTGAEEATYIKSIFLTAENGWKGTFQDIPILASGYYAIAENVPSGYHAQYSGETKTLVIDDKSVLVAVVDTSDESVIPVTVVTNIPQVRLPNTGGMGTIPIYALGWLLLASALVYIVGFGHPRRKGGR